MYLPSSWFYRFLFQYPSYSGKSTRWMHDIALLRLSEPLIYHPFIRPICLPSANETIKHGERTVITGWGSTRDTGHFRYLREVKVPIQSNDQCGFQSINWETTLCAGLCENGTCDACQVSFFMILNNDEILFSSSGGFRWSNDFIPSWSMAYCRFDFLGF